MLLLGIDAVLYGTAYAQTTTGSVDLASLPPLLQYAIALGFGIASALAVMLGLKANKQPSPAAEPDVRSALERYFDNPETLAACKAIDGKVEVLREEVRSVREILFQLATGVKDGVVSEIHLNRNIIKAEIQVLREAMEDEMSKSRELARRQEENQVTSRRITEGNIIAADREGKKEMRDKLDEILNLLNRMEERQRRTR